MMAPDSSAVPAGARAAVPAGARAAGAAARRRSPQTVEGLVVSTKMQKTIVVEVERLEKHPKYGKFVRRHSRFKVHDEKGDAREGDTVRIAQTKPLSRTKRWRLLEVLSRAKT